jgi:DNA-directed RNA polymerase specialized sigma24 family protein
MCDTADIKQSLYEWFLEHPNKLASWEILSKKETKNLIYRSLRNQAFDYCQWWKAKTLGYEKDDLFYYTPEMVENLLPTMLRGEELDRLPVLNLGKTGGGHGTPAESGNVDTMISDISRGYNALNKDDKRAVFMRFALSFPFAEIAEQMELNTEDAARMRVKRAVKHIVVKIGAFKPRVEPDDLPYDKTSGEQEAPEVYAEL